MEAHAGATDGELDRELLLVRGAITLVGAGGIPRVTLIGLHGGQDLLTRVVPAAAAAGVVVSGRPTESGAYDVVVERNG